MHYFARSGGETICNTSFYHEVKAKSGTNFDLCYQCLTCTLGCPVAFAMDYLPNQIVRLVQMGLKQQVLTSSTIWLCANCEACATRCPNDVELLRLMDTLREMALREGVAEKEKVVTGFHQVFLGNIRRWGKQNELPLVLQLKVKTKDFFSDLGSGIKMLLKGRLKLLPSRLKNLDEVRAIFQRTDRRAGGGRS